MVLILNLISKIIQIKISGTGVLGIKFLRFLLLNKLFYVSLNDFYVTCLLYEI